MNVIKNKTALLFHSFDCSNNEDNFYDLTLLEFKKLIYDLSKELNPNKITLTFDDGYFSIIPAIKYANLLGFKTKAYIITSKINSRGYLSEADILGLHKLGTNIGSHSHSHIDLSKLNQQKLIYELKHSKFLLSKIIGKEITELSIPFGNYSKNVLKTCFDFYQFVAISNPYLKSKKKLIPRLSIHKSNHQNILFIKSVLQGKLNLLFRLKLVLMEFFKKLIKPKIYKKLKLIFLKN